MWTALKVEEVKQLPMEHCTRLDNYRNARAGETGYPRENPQTSGIIWPDSHIRKSGSDPASNRTQFTWGEASSLTTMPTTTSTLLASHQAEPCSIPGRVTPVFSQVGIVPDDAADLRVFSGTFRIPCPCIPALIHAHLNYSRWLARHIFGCRGLPWKWTETPCYGAPGQCKSGAWLDCAPHQEFPAHPNSTPRLIKQRQRGVSGFVRKGGLDKIKRTKSDVQITPTSIMYSVYWHYTKCLTPTRPAQYSRPSVALSTVAMLAVRRLHSLCSHSPPLVALLARRFSAFSHPRLKLSRCPDLEDSPRLSHAEKGEDEDQNVLLKTTPETTRLRTGDESPNRRISHARRLAFVNSRALLALQPAWPWHTPLAREKRRKAEAYNNASKCIRFLWVGTGAAGACNEMVRRDNPAMVGNAVGRDGSPQTPHEVHSINPPPESRPAEQITTLIYTPSIRYLVGPGEGGRQGAERRAGVRWPRRRVTALRRKHIQATGHQSGAALGLAWAQERQHVHRNMKFRMQNEMLGITSDLVGAVTAMTKCLVKQSEENMPAPQERGGEREIGHLVDVKWYIDWAIAVEIIWTMLGPVVFTTPGPAMGRIWLVKGATSGPAMVPGACQLLAGLASDCKPQMGHMLAIQ
ncbi:hypothetical protein PR048_001739 [Dryococelus australis]|uniref:Uncharacterized protein n=1 Tax=Dryococelus australis TaxID=614101 RepID=A0ABQ9IJM9_9NEOP|nr:hypothetical protein PR048_001739 [Dryococelus australis]